MCVDLIESGKAAVSNRRAERLFIDCLLFVFLGFNAREAAAE